MSEVCRRIKLEWVNRGGKVAVMVRIGERVFTIADKPPCRRLRRSDPRASTGSTRAGARL